MSVEKETHLRSILKGVSYRIVGTLTTVSIAYFFIGNTSIAFGIGGAEAVIKIFVYYAHERAWQLMPRGTIRRMESEILAKSKEHVPLKKPVE